MKRLYVGAALSVAALHSSGAEAQTRQLRALRAELAATQAELAAAKADLASQEARLRTIETRLDATVAANAPAAANASVASNEAPPTTSPAQAASIAQGGASISPGDPSSVQVAAVTTVGVAPDDFDRAPAVAALGDQGSVITRRGQLTAEAQFEYARADRNRALFRGIEIVESVLVGTFDINESRQDVLTTALMARYGITNRFELGVRVPFVHRSDASILAPIQGNATNGAAATIDNSANGTGIGDLEVSARYQLTSAHAGRPFLIGNLQVVAPTGSNPFDVPRDSSGRALKAATGAGFWGVSPSLTAIMPTDPAVLFGTIGYTRNFGANVDTVIPPVRVVYVKPGDSVSLSAGIGVALNQRTSFNIGYAHTWAFGTRTRTMLTNPPTGDDGFREQKARDLQIGRLLFGVTYRVSDKASVNWSVEAGATDDATDLRTTVRIPLVLITGH